MNHKQKLKKAIKLMNNEEIKMKGLGPFDSSVWINNKIQKQKKQLNQGKKQKNE